MLSDCIGLLFSISANTLTAVVFISTVAVVWCYLSVPRLYVQSRWGAFPWRWRAPWLSNTERWPVERRYAHCCLREGWQLLGEGVSAHRQTNTVVRHDFIIVRRFFRWSVDKMTTRCFHEWAEKVSWFTIWLISMFMDVSSGYICKM